MDCQRERDATARAASRRHAQIGRGKPQN